MKRDVILKASGKTVIIVTRSTLRIRKVDYISARQQDVVKGIKGGSLSEDKKGKK